MNNLQLEKLLRDAQELKEMGFEEEALLILEEISLNFPNCIESYLEQIDILLNQKESTNQDLQTALEKAQHVVTLAPDNVDANYYLGYIYNLKKDWQKAKHYLEKTHQLDNHDTDTIRLLGWVLFHLGQQTTGIELLKKSIHLDPYYAEALEDLAECYLYQEKFAEASVVLEKAAEIAPSSTRIQQLKLVADSFHAYRYSSR